MKLAKDSIVFFVFVIFKLKC